MAKSTKTPVMVLQELTVKKGYDPPEYNLVYSVQGSHENEFHYEVTVHSVCAKGLGRSKKEAKHEAARLALQLLAAKGLYHPDDKSDIKDMRTEGSPLKPALNCIPRLMDICFENKLPTPEFIEISAVGPPHCREFTYECHVASITTRAIAGSKKHSKQVAAKEMLERIISVLPEITEQCESHQLKLTATDAEAIDKYWDLSTYNKVKVNFNVEIGKYDRQLKNLMKEKCLNEDEIFTFFALPPTEETLQQLLDLFELKFHLDVIQEDPPVVTLSINLDTPFSALETGTTQKDATTNALNKIFEMIKVFLE